MAVSTANNKAAVTPWLLRPRPNTHARLRLFCFPYAGGAATIYRLWQDKLPLSVEVSPVQLPGRGKRLSETPFTDVQAMVRAAAEALRPYMDMPFAFFGHSMGAMISFELARELRREHRVMPRQLFLSARRAPQVKNREKITYNLPDAEFIDDLRTLEGTPKEVLEQPELMQLMMPLLRADFAVCDTYEYVEEPPLDCPISVFGGLQDSGVTREHLQAWREQTTGAFSLRMVPGDHFFLNAAPAVLFQGLSQDLRELTR